MHGNPGCVFQAIASTDIRLLFEPFEVEEVYNKRRLHSARLRWPQQPRINIFGRLAINSLLYVQAAHSNKGQQIPIPGISF
ncbi:hypothetical protein CN068_24580 [Sinorhizobium meliloti]|nr:hypothetical protein CN068_24580 [Sinorhizobium meliloti]